MTLSGGGPVAAESCNRAADAHRGDTKAFASKVMVFDKEAR